MKYNYNQQEPFWLNHAKAIIQCNDLDPVYEGVHFAMSEIGEAKTHRFLVAMSLYYHIGFACEIAENTTDENFWAYMFANYEGTKRGTERRYFRGSQGLRCLEYLSKTYATPTEFLKSMYRPKYSEMLKAFESVPAYGPYHIWKILDFYERILGWPVDPDVCVHHLPEEPKKGAKLVAKEMGWEDKSFEEIVTTMVQMIQDQGVLAPPTMDRLIGVQEVETALCMVKHFYNGSDYVGKDLLDKYESLNGYGPVAEAIQRHIPKPVPRDFFEVPMDVVKKLDIKISKEGLTAPVEEANTNSLLAFM